MVAEWHDGFTLRSVWEPGESSGRYRLLLSNNTKSDVANIRLGLSGPALRIADDAKLSNAKIVVHLSNYLELAPAAPMVLQPGATWDIGIDKMSHALHHWTDGAVTGFV